MNYAKKLFSIDIQLQEIGDKFTASVNSDQGHPRKVTEIQLIEGVQKRLQAVWVICSTTTIGKD